MKTKYKHRFDRMLFKNRWSIPRWQRNGDWLIIGVSKHYFSICDYEYRIAFFGLEIHLWFTRILKMRDPKEYKINSIINVID